MSTDAWFVIILFVGIWLCGLLLLDGAHHAHISALKGAHREQVASLRSYIRTLSRERLWLEAEVQRLKNKAEQRDKVRAEPEHIQWLPPWPAPDAAEEYEEEDG